MKFFSLKSITLVLAALGAIALFAACSKKNESTSSISAADAGSEDAVIDDSSLDENGLFDITKDDSFLDESGQVDVEKMEEIFIEEAKKNWGIDDGVGSKTAYVQANHKLKKLFIKSGKDDDHYTIGMSGCLWENFPTDNSQSNAWFAGDTEDNDCKSSLLKVKKIGGVYVLAIRGFAGLSTILRAVIIEREYISSDPVFESDYNSSKAVAKIIGSTSFLVRASKIYLPPQIDSDLNRGAMISHLYFSSHVEKFTLNLEKPYYLRISDSIPSGVQQKAFFGIGRTTEIKGQVEAFKIKADRSLFDTMAVGSKIDLLLTTNVDDDEKQSIEIGLELSPVKD